MTFTEKLEKLTRESNKSNLAKAAGLPATAISNYISKCQMPRGDTALLLARALKVSLEWLLDDSQDWPPPPATPISGLSTEQLAQELGRRLSAVGSLLLEKIVLARDTDWAVVARQLLGADPDAEVPRKLKSLVELPGQINLLLVELDRFDPYFVLGEDMSPQLRKDHLPGYEETLLGLVRQVQNLRSRSDYAAGGPLAFAWSTPREMRPEWFGQIVEREKAKAAEAL